MVLIKRKGMHNLKCQEEIDKIIIIGNGFDCLQGLPTEYSDFSRYYDENINEISDE